MDTSIVDGAGGVPPWVIGLLPLKLVRRSINCSRPSLAAIPYTERNLAAIPCIIGARPAQNQWEIPNKMRASE